MESDFEKKLHGLRPKRLTQEEKQYLWSNVKEGIAVERYIKAHKKSRLESFNIFSSVQKTRAVIAGIITGALVFGSFGTVALANNSRPGDLLFPLELATENIRLRLVADEYRDELRIQFASERLDEVKELLALAGINFEEIGIESKLPALYTTDVATSTDDDNAATSTGDNGTDDTDVDDNSEAATTTTATSTNETNNTSESNTNTNEESDDNDTNNNNEAVNVNTGALTQASNAFLIALNYLNNTRASLVANGNDIGVLALDAFIIELTVLADSHVHDIEQTRIAVKNNNSGVAIDIQASIDNVKTQFNFKEETNGNGDTRRAIALHNGTSALSLNVDEDDTVFEENHTGNSENDRKRDFEVPEFSLCYKNKTISLSSGDLSKYLKKGARLGECESGRGDERKHDDDEDDDDRDDDSKNNYKTYLCHKGKTIHVSVFAKWAHLSRGSTIGKCEDDENNDDDDKISVPSCTLTSANNRTIVKFDGPVIRSDKNESNARTESKNASLDEGVYKVTLVSWDGYKGRDKDSQPNEEWFVQLFENSSIFGGTRLVATSNPARDIPDNVTKETVIEVVNEELVLADDIDKVRAFHNAYPDTENSNSVRPICAAFDKIGDIDESAPIISDIEVEATTTAATVDWKTNEGARTILYYGVNDAFDGSETNIPNNSLLTTHTRTLTSLSASTTYYFIIVVKDETGNTATSSVRSFTTASGAAPAGETAPLITGIVVNATTTEVAVAWSTNEQTTGVFWYGTATPLVVNGGTTGVLSSTLHTTHGIHATGLAPETVYRYIIVATDASGNTSTSSEDSFTTTALPVVDETAPTVSDLTAEASTTDAVVEFDTDEPAESTLWYSTISPVPIGAPSLSSGGFVSEHVFNLSGLIAETTYYFLIEVEDEHGNSAMELEESFTTTAPPDETAPVISGVSATPDTSTADITWNTNEDTIGTVVFGSTTPVMLENADGTVLSGTASGAHNVELTSLSASTTYYFIIVVKDETGNTATSTEVSFETL